MNYKKLLNEITAWKGIEKEYWKAVEILEREQKLTELEIKTCRLFPLLDPRVAGKESRALQLRPQFGVLYLERLRDAEFHRLGLGHGAAAADVDVDVDARALSGQDQGQEPDRPGRLPGDGSGRGAGTDEGRHESRGGQHDAGGVHHRRASHTPPLPHTLNHISSSPTLPHTLYSPH